MMNFHPNCCRLCKSDSGSLDLLSTTKNSLVGWIGTYLHINPNLDDGLPVKVCEECLNTIRAWILFYKKVGDVQVDLNEELETNIKTEAVVNDSEEEVERNARKPVNNTKVIKSRDKADSRKNESGKKTKSNGKACAKKRQLDSATIKGKGAAKKIQNAKPNDTPIKTRKKYTKKRSKEQDFSKPGEVLQFVIAETSSSLDGAEKESDCLQSFQSNDDSNTSRNNSDHVMQPRDTVLHGMYTPVVSATAPRSQNAGATLTPTITSAATAVNSELHTKKIHAPQQQQIHNVKPNNLFQEYLMANRPVEHTIVRNIDDQTQNISESHQSYVNNGNVDVNVIIPRREEHTESQTLYSRIVRPTSTTAKPSNIYHTQSSTQVADNQIRRPVLTFSVPATATLYTENVDNNNRQLIGQPPALIPQSQTFSYSTPPAVNTFYNANRQPYYFPQQPIATSGQQLQQQQQQQQQQISSVNQPTLQQNVNQNPGISSNNYYNSQVQMSSHHMPTHYNTQNQIAGYQTPTQFRPNVVHRAINLSNNYQSVEPPQAAVDPLAISFEQVAAARRRAEQDQKELQRKYGHLRLPPY